MPEGTMTLAFTWLKKTSAKKPIAPYNPIYELAACGMKIESVIDLWKSYEKTDGPKYLFVGTLNDDEMINDILMAFEKAFPGCFNK